MGYPKGHTHPFLAAIGVHQNREVGAGVLEQERLTAIAAFADPVGDLGDLELRVDKAADTHQFPCFLQCLNEFLLVSVCHAAKVKHKPTSAKTVLAIPHGRDWPGFTPRR